MDDFNKLFRHSMLLLGNETKNQLMDRMDTAVDTMMDREDARSLIHAEMADRFGRGGKSPLQGELVSSVAYGQKNVSIFLPVYWYR